MSVVHQPKEWTGHALPRPTTAKGRACWYLCDHRPRIFGMILVKLPLSRNYGDDIRARLLSPGRCLVPEVGGPLGGASINTREGARSYPRGGLAMFAQLPAVCTAPNTSRCNTSTAYMEVVGR